MLLYKNFDKYQKNHFDWSFSEVNIPNNKKDDLISRLSTTVKENSFFASALFDQNLLKHPPQDRLLSVMHKKNKLMDKLNYKVVFDYLPFMFERFMIELDYFLNEETEIENLNEFGIDQKLLSILQTKLIPHKSVILKEFENNFEAIVRSETKIKFMTNLFHEIYSDVAKDELQTVLESDEFSQEIKDKYIENIQKTFDNIFILLGHMVFEDFLEETKEIEFQTNPTNLFMLFKMIFPDENLLICQFRKSSSQDIDLTLIPDIEFDQYIDIEKPFTVLVFFPETNTYERILFESFEKNKESVKQSKKYPYKNYSFPFEHPVIKNLLQ